MGTILICLLSIIFLFVAWCVLKAGSDDDDRAGRDFIE